MKIFIASVFSLLLIFSNSYVFAETLPTEGDYISDESKYPLLHDYIRKYARKMYNAYLPNRVHFEFYSYGYFTYYIHKDGSISDVEGNIEKGRPSPNNTSRVIRFEKPPEYDCKNEPADIKEIRRIIFSTKPKPFPKDLEAEKIKIVFSVKKTDFNECKAYYYPSNGYALISLNKNQREKYYTKNIILKIKELF